MKIVYKAAELRDLGKNAEVIKLIKENFENLNKINREAALWEAFKASLAINDKENAEFFAKEIAIYDPDLDSIQPYLN